MSHLEERLASGRFVVTSELTPPKGVDLTSLLERATMLAPFVDAFNVTESAGARMAMSALAVAHRLLDHGVEPILQIVGRDRNRIGIQADMLGASALGIRNLVCMGGDPPHIGDHPEAKPVFDLFAVELLEAARHLQDGTDLSGKALDGAPSFFTGAVVNPGASDLELELDKMHAKLAAGARFLQTQAVFEPAAFERFVTRIEGLDVFLLAGIIPIKSEKMARYMNEKIPGVDIPEPLIARISATSDREAQSVTIAAETARAIRDMCHGVHVMAIGWEHLIGRIVEQAGISRGDCSCPE